MKLRNIITAIIMAAALILTSSCSKNPAFPSQLAGQWIYTNGSTGYTGVLSIEDIDGGQYAYFALVTPTKTLYQYFEGSFTYDSTTGKGSIDQGWVGSTISITAPSSTDETVNVEITQIVSGGSNTVFQGTFDKTTTASITTGEWTGEQIINEVEYKFDMAITSLQPQNGSCGTIDVTTDEEASTLTIAGFSTFAMAYGNTAAGFMPIVDNTTFVVFYDTVTKKITMATTVLWDAAVKLVSVDVN